MPHSDSQQPRALRVSQIDADDLDQGLVAMFAAKLQSALSLLPVSCEMQDFLAPALWPRSAKD